MTEVPSSPSELTHQQRRVLGIIYEPFGEEGAWPTTDAIQRKLYRAGERQLDVAAVLASLPDGLARSDGMVGGKVSLTLRGLLATYHQAELNDFMTFLRLAIERYGDSDDPKVGAYDLVQKRSFDELRLRKLGLLVDQEFCLASGSQSAPNGAPFEWSVSRDIWRFDRVYSIEDYLKERDKQLAEMRQVAAPGTPSFPTTDVGLSKLISEPGAAEDAAAWVKDDVLRTRCADLLAAGAHFDRAVFQAAVVLEDRVRQAIGGSSVLTGVSLMEHAFSAKAPKLRLSTDEREQLGAMQLYRGVIAFFRNPVGHKLQHEYTRDDAARFIAMVDLLLSLLAKAEQP